MLSPSLLLLTPILSRMPRMTFVPVVLPLTVASRRLSFMSRTRSVWFRIPPTPPARRRLTKRSGPL